MKGTIFFINFFKHLYWSIIALQWCVSSHCCFLHSLFSTLLRLPFWFDFQLVRARPGLVSLVGCEGVFLSLVSCVLSPVCGWEACLSVCQEPFSLEAPKTLSLSAEFRRLTRLCRSVYFLFIPPACSPFKSQDSCLSSIDYFLNYHISFCHFSPSRNPITHSFGSLVWRSYSCFRFFVSWFCAGSELFHLIF